jgi:hypothetical protein
LGFVVLKRWCKGFFLSAEKLVQALTVTDSTGKRKATKYQARVIAIPPNSGNTMQGLVVGGI